MPVYPYTYEKDGSATSGQIEAESEADARKQVAALLQPEDRKTSTIKQKDVVIGEPMATLVTKDQENV